MKYFYHISLKKLDCPVFNPRVPKERLKFENETIPRICVSNCIKGCLNAIKHNIFEDVILAGYKLNKKIPMYLYGVKQNIIKKVKTPKEISVFVQDSLINSEYWILDENVTFEFLGVIFLNASMNVYIRDCDCDGCCQDADCHGKEKPPYWSDCFGQWEYKKGCVYPYVDDYEMKWSWTLKKEI